MVTRNGGFAVRDQLTVRIYDRVGRWITMFPTITGTDLIMIVLFKGFHLTVPNAGSSGDLTQPTWTGSTAWLRTTRAGWSPSMRTRGAG